MTKTKSKSKTFHKGQATIDILLFMGSNNDFIPCIETPDEFQLTEKIIITVTRFVEEDKKQTK